MTGTHYALQDINRGECTPRTPPQQLDWSHLCCFHSLQHNKLPVENNYVTKLYVITYTTTKQSCTQRKISAVIVFDLTL